MKLEKNNNDSREGSWTLPVLLLGIERTAHGRPADRPHEHPSTDLRKQTKTRKTESFDTTISQSFVISNRVPKDNRYRAKRCRLRECRPLRWVGKPRHAYGWNQPLRITDRPELKTHRFHAIFMTCLKILFFFCTQLHTVNSKFHVFEPDPVRPTASGRVLRPQQKEAETYSEY